jgi:hypothetical protein
MNPSSRANSTNKSYGSDVPILSRRRMTARQNMERLNPANKHTFQLDMGHPEVHEDLYYYNTFAQTVALEDLHHVSNMQNTTLLQRFSQVPIMARRMIGILCRANISGNLKLNSF